MRVASALALFLMMTAAGFAQTLPARPADDYNAKSTEGAFDLVLRVDGESMISVRGNEIRYENINGRVPRDMGSTYSQAIPRARFGTFNMEKLGGRGTVELFEEPSAVNDYTALIRINDSDRGDDRYHVRLSWTWNPADPSRPPGNRGGDAVLGNVSDPSDYNRGREGEFVFRGRVDQVTAFYIRSDQVRSQVFRGRSSRGEQFAFSQPIPSASFEYFELSEVQGRGSVELVEKPWEGNDYTAVVRIEDDRGGSAQYGFRLVWRRQ